MGLHGFMECFEPRFMGIAPLFGLSHELIQGRLDARDNGINAVRVVVWHSVSFSPTVSQCPATPSMFEALPESRNSARCRREVRSTLHRLYQVRPAVVWNQWSWELHPITRDRRRILDKQEREIAGCKFHGLVIVNTTLVRTTGGVEATFENADSPQKLLAVQVRKFTPRGRSTFAIVLVRVAIVTQFVMGIVMSLDHFTLKVTPASSFVG